MAMKVATVSTYGDETGVRLLVATIHKGKHIIDNKVFARDHYGSPEEMMEALMPVLDQHRVQQVRQVSDMLPMEEAYCSCCGEIAGRIS